MSNVVTITGERIVKKAAHITSNVLEATFAPLNISEALKYKVFIFRILSLFYASF